MKKLNLQLGSIKEMLTKEQMKQVVGGYKTTLAPKVAACVDKKVGDACSWAYNGQTSNGTCQSYMAQPLHCSNLM